MSIDDPKVIDIASIDPKGIVILTISDHLDWQDNKNHIRLLQQKLNAYLAFVESGDIFQKYPEAKDRPVVFRVVSKFRPDFEGERFLIQAKSIVESAGFSLKHELYAESYDN